MQNLSNKLKERALSINKKRNKMNNFLSTNNFELTNDSDLV